ncbi:MAG TPA: M20/M25/M40 family metallo-hydrolase, partial [Myxococcaceae bacterium]|nr:M20/M25/M40 family metallo-hydrolase [Myxococcaceae bacterium]
MRRAIPSLATAALLLSAPLALAGPTVPVKSTQAPVKSTQRAEEPSREAAARLIGGSLADGVAYQRLEELTDTVGPRLSGTPGYEAATRWALEKLKADGIPARLEKVMVPHWVRGEERAEVLASSKAPAHPLAITALGGSVGTPEGGLTAEVVEVRSFEELRALGDKAKGKIVLFTHTMGTKGGYGDFAGLRFRGAVEAAKAGGVGMLVRSLANASLRSPHTGAMAYEDGVPQVPAAALATEDADLIHRLLQRGPVTVRLALGCKTLPDVEAANVVAEIRGREKPDEIVLISAHLDSWDLGTGAMDDGAGVAIVMEAARQISKLPRPPRRTVRVVLFANEENGLRGGRGYAEAHAAELAKHVVAMESDSGSGKAKELEVLAGEGGVALVSSWISPLATLGITEVNPTARPTGADISPLFASQVPMVGVEQDSSKYFEVHHSAADTFDKVN